MKIVIDKIETHPPHALSPLELRAFLRLLPTELMTDIGMVRLSNALAHNGSFRIASFSRLEHRLVIASREATRKQAMLQVLQCLIRVNQRRPAGYGLGKIELSAQEIERRAMDLFSQIEGKRPETPRWIRAELRYAARRPRDAV